MCGLSCSSIGRDDSGNCTMSSESPNDFDMLAMTVQVVQAPVVRIARRVDADMPDAELGPDTVIAVVAWPDLRANVHRFNIPSNTTPYPSFPFTG